MVYLQSIVPFSLWILPAVLSFVATWRPGTSHDTIHIAPEREGSDRSPDCRGTPQLYCCLLAFPWTILVPLDRQYSYETRHRILIIVNHGIETGTGILIFLSYSQYVLVSLGGGARESPEECRRLHQFRDVLYANDDSTLTLAYWPIPALQLPLIRCSPQ